MLVVLLLVSCFFPTFSFPPFPPPLHSSLRPSPSFSSPLHTSSILQLLLLIIIIIITIKMTLMIVDDNNSNGRNNRTTDTIQSVTGGIHQRVRRPTSPAYSLPKVPPPRLRASPLPIPSTSRQDSSTFPSHEFYGCSPGVLHRGISLSTSRKRAICLYHLSWR